MSKNNSKSPLKWFTILFLVIIPGYFIHKVMATPDRPSATPEQVDLITLDTTIHEHCDKYIFIHEASVVGSIYVLERCFFTIEDQMTSKKFFCVSDHAYGAGDSLKNVTFYVEPLIVTDKHHWIILKEANR